MKEAKMFDRKGRVLVVDDEESVRALLERVLAREGYTVATAANGEDALGKVSRLDIEMVLLDIKMPGMSGMEVLRQLNASRPDIGVVMVTSVADMQTAVEAMKLGAHDYITKPFNADEVVRTVQKAIQKRALQRENERQRLELETKVAGQAQQLQLQFAELVMTLAREYKLLYQMAEQQRGQSFLKKLPPELQQPMSSVEEFTEALLRILRRGVSGASSQTTERDR